MKGKFLYWYYIILILLLILYTNTSGSLPTVIRFGYLAALVVPLLYSIALYPAIILCTFCLAKHTFASPLMPTEMTYYVLLTIVFAVLALYRNKFRTTIKPLFLLILFYIIINDLLLQASLSPLVTTISIVILFYICTEGHLDTSVKFLPYAFIILSLAISYWRLFCPEAMTNTYNSLDGIDQEGWTDPNYLGCALGMGLVIAVNELIKGTKNAGLVVVFLATLILSTIALLGIASRGMVLAAALSILILLLFSRIKVKFKIIAIIFIAVFIFILYTNQYFDYLVARFNADDGTGAKRTTIWTTKLSLFYSEGSTLDWLFGIGQKGCYYLGFSAGRATHNDFISVLISYGIIGVVFLFYAIAYPLTICSKKVRPQVVAFLAYLFMCSMFIEPLARGNIAYIGFFFYITQFARQNRLLVAKNAG
jgi:O-antigen ligase